MSSLHQPKPILPWWQLGLLICGCALGVWWLLPGDAELIEDLIRDQSYTKAAQRLRDVSADELTLRPDYYRALKLKLSRIKLPPNASPEQLMQWWQRGTTAWHETCFSRAVYSELLPIIARLPDPELAWEHAQMESAEIPPQQYQRLAILISNAALAANQPKTSALLYAKAHPVSSRSEIEDLELARRWQLAGNPEHALAVLKDDSTAAAITLRISLLRALNRNQEAVSLMRARLLQQGAASIEAREAEELAAAALAAGIPQEAIRHYQMFAENHQEDLTIQRRLRDLMVAAGQLEVALPVSLQIVELSANAPEEIRTHARLAEYAGKPNEAFDSWLKLAGRTEDEAAIERLFSLNPGLHRDTELAQVLQRIGPVSGHEEYTLRLAELMQNIGYYYEAEEFFADYLALVPDDFETAVTLATLHYELFEYEDAEKWYGYASALKPELLETRMAVANTVMMQNRPEDSFRIYEAILRDHPTEEVIANYIRLAESLGRYKELAHGLREQIKRNAQPSLSDYTRLAYAFARMNETALSEETLYEGLQHFPHNPTMRVSLAQILADRKEYKEAQRILSSSSNLHSDLSTALLYLDLLRLNNDLTEEQHFLTSDFAPEIRENESLLTKIARSYEAQQKLDEATIIWRKLLVSEPNNHERIGHLARVIMRQGREAEAHALLKPYLKNPSPAILRLAAEVSVAGGDYLNAEQYQLEFLSLSFAPRATDWGKLGDIRLSRGDEEGAIRAYQSANRLMISRLLHPGETDLTKETLVARAHSLSLDDRHYLLYLSARTHDAQTAQGLAHAILQSNPSDRQTLLVLASMALAKQNAQETLRLARIYLHFYPDDYQGLYFLGAGHYLAKEYSQANAVLRDLKHSQYQNRKYPFETDLASSALQAGDWYRAMLAYQQLLRHHNLNDELRSDVRYVLDGIYRAHGRRIEFGADRTRLKRAGVWRYRGIHAAHISNRNWLELSYRRDQIDLQDAPGLRAASRHREQVAARLSRSISTRWKGDLWLGDSGRGLLGGAALRYRFAQQREATFEQTLSERATDSLALEALDGRESRSSLNINWLIEADLSLGLRAHTRSIHIGGDKLGRSTGAELNIDQTIRRHGPYISIGYRSSYATFSPEVINLGLANRASPIADPLSGPPARNAIIRNLVSSRLNRHGGGLLISDNIADAWTYRLTLGADYDFELSSLGWNGGLYVAFFPRKSIELSAETGYTSSATNSNAGNAATLTNFLFRLHY